MVARYPGQIGRTDMHDIAIIGGGLVGASVALGLARLGQRVLMLDGADLALRASRANFALVWVQGKGRGTPAYARWSLRAAQAWPEFARALQQDCGLDLALRQPGGFSFALGPAEVGRLLSDQQQIDAETGGTAAPWQWLDAAALRRQMPQIGPAVAGAVFSPADGHVNALRLFHGLHRALARRGVDYRAHHPVAQIEPRGGGFDLAGPWGRLAVPRVVIAAGVGSDLLAAQVGIPVPLRRSRGQVLVTQKTAPFLAHVSATLRQTDEGSVLIGDSDEADSAELLVPPDVAAVMASRAVQVFPHLARLNVLRSWSGFRVKTRDGLPVYQQSTAWPGAFAVLCHSGVTLAPLHAGLVAEQIAAGGFGAGLAPFGTERFGVQTA